MIYNRNYYSYSTPHSLHIYPNLSHPSHPSQTRQHIKERNTFQGRQSVMRRQFPSCFGDAGLLGSILETACTQSEHRRTNLMRAVLCWAGLG
ncbi:hypothetical protein E2C01_100364 [Portunus trituberculatus]|uniref:Uncharacterized protein n=1 Tax=Portunus trituberculatus TaxID=210409 RepID=A0A5B7KCW4_PORTR|nr:hypothetical protein [Portunus trituberculatus]